MKIAGKAVRTLIGLALGAGLLYAGSALRSKSVYASSACTDCFDEQLEAEDFCSATYHNSNLSLFKCPVTPTSNLFEFVCTGDPSRTPQFDDCLDDFAQPPLFMPVAR